MPSQSGLPTGTVTFLFTDIEGSTGRWEEHPEQMSVALARHDGILRVAIELHGGHVFKTVGDAFCASFSTPHQALLAALQAQVALGKEDWDPLTGAIRVRMALHTGVAEERDGDYFGQPVNRVARILSAGHGGQTLLSNATYDLVRDALPSGAQIIDLGAHRLKDLIRPENIFQLVIPGLLSQFPPLKTLDAHPNNLPRQATPLIGREKEIEKICAILGGEHTTLVTLTGPGGTGKTRLALQVAADMLDDFADGVWFVDLSPIIDEGLVISTIAQALGVRENAGEALADTLRAYLKEKRLLLVLDNFEQVAGAAPTISDLVLACPRLKVLVTSRVPLRIRGEKEYLVSPLSLPDYQHLPPLANLTQYEAVRLFIERATDIKPDFEVNNDNAPAVAEICVRLDGLPLAIELAAARIRLFPPQALLARLSNRLKLLTGGAHNLPARQQTLLNTMEWSYDLLSPGAQQLFRRMAVFQGGRTLEALEAVCTYDEQLQVDVLEGVESLVEGNLLQQRQGTDGEARFWMLETVHEYAREKLTGKDEEAEIRNQHAEYFSVLAETFSAKFEVAEQGEWLDHLQEEHDNLRAALSWTIRNKDSGMALRLATALVDFWITRGYVSEGRTHIAAVLATTQASEHLHSKARALNGAAQLAWAQADYTSSNLLAEEALAIFRELGDRMGLARALIRLGSIAGYRGDYLRQAEFCEQALDLSRQFGSKREIANQLVNLGCALTACGDNGRANICLVEGLSIFRELGSKNGQAFALQNLGELAQQREDYNLALGLYEESLGLYSEMDNKRWMSICLSCSAAMEHRLHSLRQATTMFKMGLTLAHKVSYKYGIAACVSGLGGLAASRSNPERAAQLLAASETLLATLGATFFPVDQTEHSWRLAMARQMTDEETWQAAWQIGHAMTMDQAIAYALEDTNEQ